MDRTVSRSLTNFAAKFCNELGTSKTSVCSPLSAETVLALLALGCRGQARAELLQALDMADDDHIRSSFALLISTLKSIKGATLSMANRVYLKKGATLKPAIKKDAEEVFGSDLEQLDFNEREAAAGIINQWVAQQTNNLIKDVVSAETFKEETCMLLINAIYFRLLRIPYKGGEASMVIVLPDEIEGLNGMLQQLAEGYDLITDIETMKNTMLDIMIPKFKAEITIDLKELLPKLGIKSIFDNGTSNIDMLTSNSRLFVSEAIQKAFIEVDEVGTEAAACTMIGEMQCCLRRNPRFIANRPFLYLLTCHEIPIFIGVYEGSEYAITKTMKTGDI